MFSRDYLLASDWYRQRLAVKQQRDIALWQSHLDYLQQFLRDNVNNAVPISNLQLAERYRLAQHKLQELQDPAYLQSLFGTLGADPSTC